MGGDADTGSCLMCIAEKLCCTGDAVLLVVSSNWRGVTDWPPEADVVDEAEVLAVVGAVGGFGRNECNDHLLFSVEPVSTFFVDPPMFDSSLDDSGDVVSEPLSLELSFTGDILRK